MTRGTLNELALFAGAGGGILGSSLLGWRTVCAVEIEPYCREVLLRRQEEQILESFPIWDDIRTFDGKPWRGKVDVITAGFPCQPFSVAGSQRGEGDERNLWPETIRTIREVQPTFCLLENVPGLLTIGYFGQILGDLAESGYNARWCVLGARDVEAPHKRDRVWVYCSNSREVGCQQGSREGIQSKIKEPEGQEHCNVSNEEQNRGDWWRSEPNVDRVANGVAFRVDRIKAIGNGQVPAVVRAAWDLLTND